MTIMSKPATPTAYPPVRRTPHEDIYKSKKNGTVTVHDPYNWLEGKGPEVDLFIQGEYLVFRLGKAVQTRQYLL